MVCKHCGAEVADELTFCTVCGEEMINEAPSKKGFLPEGSKKKFTIIAIAAAAIAVIILAICLLSGDGADDRVEDLYESAVAYDLNSVLEALPPEVLKYYKAQLDLNDSELEIVDTNELKESRVKELDMRYQQKYGTKAGYIEEAAEVEIELEYRDKDISRDTISVYMVKVDGSWYLDLLLTLEELEEAEFKYDKLPSLAP